LLPDTYPEIIQPAAPAHQWLPRDNHVRNNELVLAEPSPPIGEPPSTTALCKSCGRPVTRTSADNTVVLPRARNLKLRP